MDEEKGDIIELIRNNWYILIFVAIYFFYKGKWGISTFDKAQFYAITGIFLIGFAKMFWEYGKYNSPMIVWYSGSASINHNDTRTIGDWKVFRLGGIDYGYLSFPGNEGVLIVPSLNCEKIGNRWATPVRPHKVALEYVPPEVRDFLLKEGYPMKKILLGYYPIKYEINQKDALNLQSYNKQLNASINDLRDLLEGKQKVVEDSVDHSLRIMKRTRGNILERLFRGRPPDDGTQG